MANSLFYRDKPHKRKRMGNGKIWMEKQRKGTNKWKKYSRKKNKEAYISTKINTSNKKPKQNSQERICVKLRRQSSTDFNFPHFYTPR